MLEELMNAMMLSCVKATQLVEQRDYFPLNFKKSVQLQLHVAMCSGCRNYVKQSKLINNLLQRQIISVQLIENTDELEAAIIAKLK